VAGLRAHPSSEEVLENCYQTLTKLVHDHPANQTRAVAAGGIEAVVAGLQAQPGSKEVQMQGCNVLFDMLANTQAPGRPTYCWTTSLARKFAGHQVAVASRNLSLSQWA
jgi:hypothetical protein